MTEFEFIAWIKTQVQAGGLPNLPADIVLGMGDDCALIRADPAELMAISTDTLVEGTHFYPSTDPLAIGHKAAASNLSDLAAMGAKPVWCTLALTLPGWDEKLACGIVNGVLQVLHRSGAVLIGGDTTRGPLSVTLTVGGSVPEALALRRSGAKIGDLVFVTGTLGDAGGGLILRRLQRSEITTAELDLVGLRADASAEARATLLARLDRPTARVLFGQRLRGIASAALDISDGFLQDLQHLCAQSGVGALIDIAALPLSDSLTSCFNLIGARQLASTAGEDYELCLTAGSQHLDSLKQAAEDCGIALTQVGIICTAPINPPRVQCWSTDKIMPELSGFGFSHF